MRKPQKASAPKKTSTPATPRAHQKQVLKRQLGAKKAQLASVQTQLRAVKRDEAAITAELTQIEQQLGETRRQLAETKDHLERARREQERVTKALAASQRALSDAEQHLAERLAANYRQGPVRYASVLLGAHTMGEMVSRAQLVRSIVKFEAALIAKIKASREQVLRWKAQVDARTHEVEQLQVALGARLDAVATTVQRRRAVLLEARQRRAEMEQEFSALEADSNALARKIQSMEVTSLGEAFTGKLSRPVDGPIVSKFGMRYHPILHYNRLHAGLDFGSPTGTPIRAAGAGWVVHSGTMRGYGNVIVIEHGGGLSTLYAHCSALLVAEGQQVAQGQVVARVGQSGLATGPHLHFEVRRGGSPVNPLTSGL